MNTRSEFCSFLICEDLDKRDEEPLPIIIKSDMYALSKSHLRKSLPIVLTKMIKERDFYIQCCKDAMDAVHNAVVLEEVAKMAYRAEVINPKIISAPQELQDKHYYRKHGANAYYGQN